VSPRNTNWIAVVAIVLFHAGSVTALFLFTPRALCTALALLWISGGWGIGMGYHRLLTHRAYETPKWMEYALAVCGSLALQGGPLFWVSTHRMHHQNADRAGDPHSPRDGLWWSHAGWLARSAASESDDLSRFVPDLRRDRFLCALERWHFVPVVALACILGVWGWRLGGPHLAASLVSWGIFFRTTVEWHGTWAVNSAAHRWGTRRYATRDDSTNNWWVALLTFGEGWHNNHHADPRSARHGLVWYEFDVNWLCIALLAKVGLARDVHAHRAPILPQAHPVTTGLMPE
jgi:fatty-acid desaturase